MPIECSVSVDTDVSCCFQGLMIADKYSATMASRIHLFIFGLYIIVSKLIVFRQPISGQDRSGKINHYRNVVNRRLTGAKTLQLLIYYAKDTVTDYRPIVRWLIVVAVVTSETVYS